MKKEIKYPATKTVHWPSGPVNACEEHARAIIALGNALSSHIVATKLDSEAECNNCVNEKKIKTCSSQKSEKRLKNVLNVKKRKLSALSSLPTN